MHANGTQPQPIDGTSGTAGDAACTLLAMLEHSLGRYRNRPASRYLGRTLSYGELDEASRALAAYLQSLGLQTGDRVAVMLPNLPQVLVAALAVLRAGCVLVHVDPQPDAQELTHRLNDSGAAAIIAVDACAALLRQVLAEVSPRHVVLATLGDMAGVLRGRIVNRWARGRDTPGQVPVGAVSFARALALGRRLPLRPVAVGADDIALLQYTGGTAGPSKAAVLLHRNLLASVRQARDWSQPALSDLAPGEQPVLVAGLPLHHLFAFNQVLLLGLHIGACSLLIAQPRDIAGTLKTLSRQRFHAIAGVGGWFAALARHPDSERVDWSSLRLSVAGGMAVSGATARLWQGRTGCPLCEGYGQTETCATATCNPAELRLHNSHVGQPLPGTELRLLDEAGHPVPTGMPGEITLRGPQLMAGYWRRPDETAQVMSSDGWYRSGDIGLLDERGNLRLIGRKTDRIVVGGIQVYPNEVEDLVTQLPGVMECAAVGMHHATTGQAVKLLVVREPQGPARPTEADIRAHCEHHLSGYMRPDVVEFRDTLPRTAQGGLLRRALSESA